MEEEKSMLKPGQIVLIDVFGGEVMAYVFNSLEKGHEKVVPVPPELAKQIREWVEQIAPGVSVRPHHCAPDCMYEVVEKEQ